MTSEAASVGWGQIILLAVTSGIAAGLMNQLLSWWREGRQRKFTAEEQEKERAHLQRVHQDEREHQRLLRREEAHARARDEYIERVQNLHDWIQYEWGKRFGLDVDYASSHAVPPKFTKPEEAIKAAREVAIGHPTREVRAAAVSIEHSIDGCFNQIVGNRLNEPSDEDFREWSSSVDELIDLLHVPD